MNVKEVLRSAIEKAGGNGLVNCWMECGCSVDDLSPGSCLGLDCEIAKCEILKEPRGDCGVGDLWFFPIDARR